ncbi:MAG: hypothetical protein A2603_12720 [Bdellovibrionales bacterium RIFOXYD1_FULL_55_31]|nr:MAG: hypothetical protein A2603_12720 [Bdellovibrionales bacterium RIFOXYD1_FULL_55_31]
MKNVFEFKEYRSYLQLRLGSRGQRTGQRLAAAKAMRCHSTFVSQVMNGRAELSLEQATLLSEHLGHTVEEEHYFLLLVQEARAGSVQVRHYFKRQRDEILNQRMSIRNRLKDAAALSEMDEAKFYSNWLYCAVHVLTTIERLQTAEALADFLGVSRGQVNRILDFLVSLGLVDQSKDGRYQMSQKHIICPRIPRIYPSTTRTGVCARSTLWIIRAMRICITLL